MNNGDRTVLEKFQIISPVVEFPAVRDNLKRFTDTNLNRYAEMYTRIRFNKRD